MCPAKVEKGRQRGFIVPIGGSEDKLRDREILNRFLEMCGGSNANIVVIPTASDLDDTGARYQDLFRELGAREVDVLHCDNRKECNSQDFIDLLETADGVFMTGGNQLRLSTTLGGTRVAQQIRRRNAAGMHVAGTSAGAAFVPEHMIAGGHEGSTPTPDMVKLAP